MLPYKRAQRVSHLIRKEASDIIMNRLKDPRLGFITVTDVQVSDDLKTAHVYYSVLEEDDRELTEEILQGSRSYIRSELSKRIQMKFTPELEFHFDEAPRYGSHIEKLIRDMNRE